jgi:hypothetical protein
MSPGLVGAVAHLAGQISTVVDMVDGVARLIVGSLARLVFHRSPRWFGNFSALSYGFAK